MITPSVKCRQGTKIRDGETGDASATPMKYQQITSCVRRVGFLPVHNVISMQAMIAQNVLILMPFCEPRGIARP